MTPALKLRDVPSTGMRTGMTIHGPLTLPDYPPSPEAAALRQARVDAGISLREMARRLGISAVDLSAVERGSKVPEDWGALWRATGLVPR